MHIEENMEENSVSAFSEHDQIAGKTFDDEENLK